LIFSFYQPEAYIKNPKRRPHAEKIPSLTKKLIASDGSLAGIVMQFYTIYLILKIVDILE